MIPHPAIAALDADVVAATAVRSAAEDAACRAVLRVMAIAAASQDRELADLRAAFADAPRRERPN